MTAQVESTPPRGNAAQWALCLIALCIVPLSGVRREVFNVTLNIPEVLILALALKEGIVFLIRRERFARAMPVFAVAGFAAAAAAGIATGAIYHNGAGRVLQDFRQFFEFVALFWLVTQRVTERKQAARIALCFVLGASFGAAHAIVQHYLATGGLAAEDQLRIGSFYHVNTFGALMVLAVATACGIGVASRRRPMQALMLACVLLCLFAAVYSKSRGAWLSMAVALALIALAFRLSWKTLAVAAAVTLVFAAIMGPSIARRIVTLSDPDADESLMGRARFYTAATEIFRTHPLFGLGWGCYYDVNTIVRNRHFVPVERKPGVADATVHSLYLQLLVKTGLVGLLAFLAILVAWFERLWSARRAPPRGNPDFALFAGISAGLVGCLFQNAVENFFHHPVIAMSFWLLLGLSFVTAQRTAAPERKYGVPLAVVAGVGALFLVFVYACLRIETYDATTSSYRNNIADAKAQGDFGKALSIARNATVLNRRDPMAFTTCARLVLEFGETMTAMECLDKAVRLDRGMTPPYPDTRKPYFFAPARLTMGELWLREADSRDAVLEFDRARGYADLRSDEYAEFREPLYCAYARQGLWARALEFGEPTDTELDALDAEPLERLGRVCEGKEDWPLASRVAKRLLNSAYASYLEGRVAFAAGRFEESETCLQQSGPEGQALFLLGEALEQLGRHAQAVEAWFRVPSGSPHAPFALAKAWACIAQLSEAERSALGVTPETMLARIDGEIAALPRIQPPVARDASQRWTPVAFKQDDTYFKSGGRFPLLVAWEDAQAPATSEPLVVHDGEPMTLRRGNIVLQLAWAENLLHWDGIEHAPENAGEFPGWVDTAREWFSLRNKPAAHRATDDIGNAYLSIDQLTWFQSVPVPAHAGAGYLLAGRIKTEQGNGSLTWQALSVDERVPFERTVAKQGSPSEWTALADYAVAQPAWETMRVQLDIVPHTGSVEFDDVMLVEIGQPRSD